ncbi:hypothetical protein [Caulobacter sp. 17J80-11]|uniref:hypothetical protein n=1 Tax=Caulobacter sp. 17J80-11 TaxID=2763502 RepID=UPI0016539D39|nr:hypothetical protein [Caulobacter sp. 17J80-11]MBC6980928.1 hypothetical protein [Caulobacter sp. 17J80-11]
MGRNLRGFIGACALAFAVLAGCGPAQAAGWLKAESKHFVVYGQLDERMLRDYAQNLEEFDAVLRLFHGVADTEASPRKFEIYLVNNANFRRVYPHAPDGVVGFYIPAPRDLYAVAMRTGSDKDTNDYAFHEYVHHFMMQNFPYAYPAWMVEGWAEYFMTVDVRPDRIDIGRYSDMRAGTLFASWMPLKDLLGKSVWQIDGEQRGAFYAQAWLLVHYMQATPERHAQLTAYLRAVGQGGEDPVAAMTRVTGQTLPALEQAMRDYIDGKFFYRTLSPKPPIDAEVKITALPASAGDLLMEVQRMKRGVEKEDRARFVADVRKRAAKYEGDRFAQLALANVEIDYGARAIGEDILQRMLKANPDDVEALRLMAESCLQAGDADPDRRAEYFAKARPYLARANKLVPDHYQTLYAYARSRSTDPDYPSENTLNVLLLSHQLAPQVTEISLKTADALIRRDRKDEARTLLKILANAPHRGADAEAAKAMLARLDAPAKTAEAGG